MEFTSHEKRLADVYEYFFNGEKSTQQYFQKDNTNKIAVVKHKNELDQGLNTLTTIGLTAKVGLELIAVNCDSFSFVEKLMADIGFFLMTNDLHLQTGDILRNVIDKNTQSDLEHILVVDPFLWSHDFGPIQFKLLVPISEVEWQFAEDFGIERLLELFQIYDLDLSIWNRKSIEIPALF